jgi:hypothetical protein
MTQLDASVRRMLIAKARLGLHVKRTVSLDDLSEDGRRPAARDGREQAQPAVDDLLKDDRNQVPLRVPREAAILYLSVLDYPSGWRIAAPSRTFIPELRTRWPNVTSIELSDRSTTEEIESGADHGAAFRRRRRVVFVRTASASGRMDLPAGPGEALTRHRAPDRRHAEAVRDDLFRVAVRADGGADPASDAADLRLLRSDRDVARSAPGR